MVSDIFKEHSIVLNEKDFKVGTLETFIYALELLQPNHFSLELVRVRYGEEPIPYEEFLMGTCSPGLSNKEYERIVETRGQSNYRSCWGDKLEYSRVQVPESITLNLKELCNKYMVTYTESNNIYRNNNILSFNSVQTYCVFMDKILETQPYGLCGLGLVLCKQGYSSLSIFSEIEKLEGRGYYHTFKSEGSTVDLSDYFNKYHQLTIDNLRSVALLLEGSYDICSITRLDLSQLILQKIPKSCIDNGGVIRVFIEQDKIEFRCSLNNEFLGYISGKFEEIHISENVNAEIIITTKTMLFLNNVTLKGKLGIYADTIINLYGNNLIQGIIPIDIGMTSRSHADNLIINGTNGSELHLIATGDMQPGIGPCTRTGMSYNRWGIEDTCIENIVLNDICIEIKTQVEPFIVGTYGKHVHPYLSSTTKSVPILKLNNSKINGMAHLQELDCDIVTYMGSTKMDIPAKYTLVEKHEQKDIAKTNKVKGFGM